MRGGAPAEVNRRSAQPRPTGGQLPFLGQQVGIGGVRGSEGVALLVRGARAAAARPAKCRITERMTRPPTERFVHKVLRAPVSPHSSAFTNPGSLCLYTRGAVSVKTAPWPAAGATSQRTSTKRAACPQQGIRRPLDARGLRMPPLTLSSR